MNILLSKAWKDSTRAKLALMPLLFWATTGLTQVPVDDSGNVVGEWEQSGNAEATGNEGIPLLSRQELQELVGPVALYPDDLLAIVLPASTYPLQIVQAARFLDDLKSDPSLKPDEDWDDSIVAVLNYPEIVELLNEDLDWTWQMGEAVVAQQGDVVTAIEAFRNTAYAAGNLHSDVHQNVSRDEGVIEITPVSEEIIYVPYYEPEHVVVYQPRPVYHYYARPYPVYYYPYADSYAFHRGFFWGVTTAFTIGWTSDRLHVFHHSYSGHPYYGHHYRDRWWYRKPSVHIHNSVYINQGNSVATHRYTSGDYWRPSRNTRLRYSDQRITRNVHYPSQNTRNYVSRQRDVIHYKANQRTTNQRTTNRRTTNQRTTNRRISPIRERSDNVRRAPAESSHRRSNDQRTGNHRSNDRKSIVRQPSGSARKPVERSQQRESRERRDGSAQPRNGSGRESRQESRADSRNTSRKESRADSRNKSRKESRQVEQRQARNREEPRRRRH